MQYQISVFGRLERVADACEMSHIVGVFGGQQGTAIESFGIAFGGDTEGAVDENGFDIRAFLFQFIACRFVGIDM